MKGWMEDATGFGAAEWRMTRDLVLRPAATVEDQQADETRYPRPSRYFLILNGVYVTVVNVIGGFTGVLALLPIAAVELGLRLSGKSIDAFSADFDQWYSWVAIPIVSLCCVPPLAWLFRRWTSASRAPTRQAFTFMSGWTLYGIPVGLISLTNPSTAAALSPALVVILVLLFIRMGRGVWWTTGPQAARRAALLLAVLAVAYMPASLMVVAAAFAGASFMP